MPQASPRPPRPTRSTLARTALGLAAWATTACASAPPPPRAVNWQQVTQASGVDASLRGLCAVDGEVAWASGAAGTWLRTVDGGAHWQSGAVPGAEKLDFRDVHAWDADRAVFLSAGSPARIYSTEDGGRTFNLRHQDERDGVFFDAMDFWDDRSGAAFSDPVDGSLLVLLTRDAGLSWTPAPDSEDMLQTLPGEAGFAASGTCLTTVRGTDSLWIGLGGETGATGARLFHSQDRGKTWSVSTTRLNTSASAGVFSIAFDSSDRGILVGGDYLAEDATQSNALQTMDGGKSWLPFAGPPPGGYRSAVACAPGLGEFLAGGPNGIDRLVDDGWTPLFEIGCNALSFAPTPRPGQLASGWCVGRDGNISRIEARLGRNP